MATLRDIRTRIASVKNTQQVTRAMKMVAAAKLRRAQESIFKTRPYAFKIGEIIDHLKRQGTVDAHPLLKARDEVRGVLLIVITGDRGLAGAFNSNVIKSAESLIQAKYSGIKSSGQLYMAAAGRKGVEHFGRRGYQMEASLSGIFRDLSFSVAHSLGDLAVEGFLDGKWDEVFLVFNEFRNTIAQNRIVSPLLPVPPEQFRTPVMQLETIHEPRLQPNYRADYIFEPDPRAILNQLVPLFVNFEIWRALLESNAAEQSARMVAMDNATSNANELLRSLQLQYNRERWPSG